MGDSHWLSILPLQVEIVEVGPRDGLQMIEKVIATEHKIRLVNSLIEAGVGRIEVTSFVHPKLVPQLADAAELMATIRRDGCVCMAMVPNLKGAKRALEAGVDMLDVVVSASEAHNQRNVRQSVDDSLVDFESIFELAGNVPIRCSMATAFGCPFEGNVPLEKVLYIARRLHELRAQEISLCDTTGMTNPVDVYQRFTVCRQELPRLRWAAHFHNTRGAGAANLLAALAAGVTILDTSLGGMGGCPFAPGATGNVCTEDMVHMLHEMGIETGIDLERLIRVALLAQELVGQPLPGQVMKAGRSCDLHL